MEYERNRAGDWRYADLARRVDQLEHWQETHDLHHEEMKQTVQRIEGRFASMDAAIGRAVWLLVGTLLTTAGEFLVNTLTKVH